MRTIGGNGLLPPLDAIPSLEMPWEQEQRANMTPRENIPTMGLVRELAGQLAVAKEMFRRLTRKEDGQSMSPGEFRDFWDQAHAELHNPKPVVEGVTEERLQAFGQEIQQQISTAVSSIVDMIQEQKNPVAEVVAAAPETPSTPE